MKFAVVLAIGLVGEQLHEHQVLEALELVGANQSAALTSRVGRQAEAQQRILKNGKVGTHHFSRDTDFSSDVLKFEELPVLLPVLRGPQRKTGRPG